MEGGLGGGKDAGTNVGCRTTWGPLWRYVRTWGPLWRYKRGVSYYVGMPVQTWGPLWRAGAGTNVGCRTTVDA